MGLLEELEAARCALTDARQKGITKLTAKLNNVQVSLRPNTNRSEYIKWVNHVLERSNVYTPNKEQIASTFDPIELAEIVRTNDSKRLVEVTDISPGSAENFIQHDDLND